MLKSVLGAAVIGAWLLPGPLFATPLPTIDTLIEVAEPNSLYLIDIDSCVLESSNCLGTRSWVRYYTAQGKPESKDTIALVQMYNDYLVNPAWSKTLSTLREKNCKVLAFTQTNAQMRALLQKTLSESSIDFASTSPFPDAFELRPLAILHAGFFHKGTLTCLDDAPTSLKACLQHFNYSEAATVVTTEAESHRYQPFFPTLTLPEPAFDAEKAESELKSFLKDASTPT